jgi:hypothetical protein
VINNGSATASGRFYSYLYLDGNRIGSWYTDNLAAGYYAYVSDWSYTVSTPGWHTLKIVADATGAIGESNENDNSWERNFYWEGGAKPNLTPYTPSGWDYPIVPSSVQGTTRVNTLYTGQPTYIDWAVINNGSATASGRFYSYLYLDGTRIGSWYTDNLAAGYYAYVSDWSYTVSTSGWHTLKIVADATGAIGESNENDNTWEKGWNWESTCPTQKILSVTAKKQEQTNWCWAATAQAIMGFHGTSVRQCDLANWLFGQTTCCANPGSAACNKGATNAEQSRVYSHWGFSNTPVDSSTSFATVKNEICNNRPIKFGWAWTGGGGHALTMRGYYDGTTDYVYYIDPGDASYNYKTYSWVVSGDNHTWSTTIYNIHK